MTAEPPETVSATLANLAPLPHPDTADVAAVARWLAVQTLRWREHARLRPEPLPSQRQVQDMNLAFGALHALRTLAFVCGSPEYASLRRAEKAAQDIAVAWRDGDYDDWLAMHCAALGVDTDEVRRLAEAEVAANRVRMGHDGRTGTGMDSETPEEDDDEETPEQRAAHDAEIVALRAQLPSVLAGKLREAEAKLGAADIILRSFLAEYGDSALPTFKVALDLAHSLEKALRAGEDDKAQKQPGIIAFQPDPEPGACDAEQYGDGPASMLDGKCRCMVCGRCGHHTGNSHQGHYWRWCKVTGSMRDFHFCCSDPAYGCELEAPSPDGDGGTQEQAS